MDDQFIMPFGKYKGRPISEVPNGYLLYLYDQNKLTGKVKKYAEENIPVLRYKLGLNKDNKENK